MKYRLRARAHTGAARAVVTPIRSCAACGAAAHPCEHDNRGHSIHRDGFGVGPEVLLCCACGANETPTLAELWARIRARREAAS
jgi:hypothetical protein